MQAIVVDLVPTGALWAATSVQLPAFRVFGDDRESVEAAVREELGPAVTIEFRVLRPEVSY